MKNIFVAAILFLALIVNAQSISEKDRKEILNALENQRIAWNDGNIEKYMEGYWKSDSLRFIGKSGITYGWKATLERYKKSYPDKDAMGLLKFQVLSLEFLSPNTAFMIGKWDLKRKGDKNVGGYFTLIWEKIGRVWLITTDHSS